MNRTLRMLRVNRWSSIITILGFATGLAAALLLLIFIQHELSYDTHWQNGDRMFAVHTTLTQNGKSVEFPICLRKAYTELPGMARGIEAATQLYKAKNPEIRLDDRRFRNFQFFYVDSTFFEVFRMNSVAGDLQQALRTPYAIVLNQRTANELFGVGNPIGKVLFISEPSLANQMQPARVTAVVPDLPKTSHFDFDVLLPMTANRRLDGLVGLEFYTYYVLEKNAPVRVTQAEIEEAYSRIGERWARSVGLSARPVSKLIPVGDVYLYPHTVEGIGRAGDPKTIRIFTLLTVLILVIAIANFVNLFLVQGGRRSLETGVRKTFGATRFQLIRHFLKESFAVSGISFLIALYLVSFLIEPFGSLVRRPLSMSALLQPEVFAGVGLLFVITALLAGSYPAWYLSGKQPIQVLHGTGTSEMQKQHLRKGIMLVQFAICMLLLTNLVILQEQVDFMNGTPLGFDAKDVVAYQNLSPQLQNSYALIRDDLRKNRDVTSVTGSHSRPGKGASGQSIKVFGKPDDSRVSIREVRVQPDYLETYGMRLLAGRSFKADRPTDRQAVILNEAAVAALGMSEPVGSRIVLFNDAMEVIGVVRDYHYASLRDPIKPEVFTYYRDDISTISLRIATGDPRKTLDGINRVFQKYDPEYAPDYVFLQDAFAAMYGDEYRIIQLITAGSILATVLTILGLAAITAITIRARTKEIGIRKAVGASSAEIVRMLVGSQMRRLIITTVVSGLVAFWTIHQWLENYAYRIDVSLWMFLLTGATILLIALAVTAVISYRAASANPVEALRYE